MKKISYFVALIFCLSCNVSVDKQNEKDSSSKFDSTLDKVDNKLNEFGDSAKEKFNDIKTGLKRRLDKDSTTGNEKD